MKNTLTICALISISSLAAGCATIEANDRGMLGEPSTAVAMYSAQLNFADAMCKSEGLLQDPRKSATFVTMSGVRGLSLSHYNKYYPEFSAYLNNASNNYQKSGAAMSQNEKMQFCSGYNKDIERQGFVVATVQKSIDFQKYFSPPSEEFLSRSNDGAVALAVLSVGATVAGVQQTNKGNFSNANTLNQTGGMLADGIVAPSQPKYCASYAPFARSNSPAGDGVWRNYYSIQSC